MGLLWQVLRLALRLAVRFALLLGTLFAAHLLLSRLVPHVRETARLLEQAPVIERELEAALRDQQRAQERVEALESKLRAESEARIAALRREAHSLRDRAESLANDEQRALAEIADAQALVREYCDTYNPIKWWYCGDIRARSEALERGLERTVLRVRGEIASAGARAREIEAALERAAGDPVARLELLRGHAPDETSEMLRNIERARLEAAGARQVVTDTRRRRAAATAARASLSGWLLTEWRRSWPRLVGITLAVLLLPWVQRTLWFYGLMPLVDRVRPIRLAARSEHAQLATHAAHRSLRVSLAPGEVLSVRQSYARPIEGRAESRLLYRFSAPFVSYAAGLVMMTRLTPRSDRAGATSATLAAPDDPDAYLMRIDLTEHPGVVIRPRQLVGLLGELKLRTAWRPFSIHAWSTWQLRYILLQGSGSIIVEGSGDVVAESLDDSRAKIEQKFVVGFDSQLAYRTSRTETFLPYLLGKVPLVDDVFEGTGTYLWQKSTSAKAATVTERTFDLIFGALGKLLGF